MGKWIMRQVLALVIVAAMSSFANAADWPPATDYLNGLGDCSASKQPGSCQYSRDVWVKEYGEAVKGEYQGQRNVAYCLSTGCHGAIRVNKMLGCAWRFVILESGHLSADSSDTSNLDYYCGPENVDKAERRAAEAQSRRMLKMLGI